MFNSLVFLNKIFTGCREVTEGALNLSDCVNFQGVLFQLVNILLLLVALLTCEHPVPAYNVTTQLCVICIFEVTLVTGVCCLLIVLRFYVPLQNIFWVTSCFRSGLVATESTNQLRRVT